MAEPSEQPGQPPSYSTSDTPLTEHEDANAKAIACSNNDVIIPEPAPAQKVEPSSLPSDDKPDIATLNPEDAEFEHISRLDSTNLRFKTLESKSYHSPEDLETLSRYRTEIDRIMSEVRQISIPGNGERDGGNGVNEGEAKILELCSKASAIEEKRKKLQDKIDSVQGSVSTIQSSLEKINKAVAHWEDQRDFIKVGRWIVIQKKALRVLGFRDMKDMNIYLKEHRKKKKGKSSSGSDTKRKRSRNLPTSSQIRKSIDADDFIEAASIMMSGGTKRKLVDVDVSNDPSSSPHHPSKKAKMVNLFNFYLSGGEKKQANLHDDGFKLLYDKNDPDGEGIIVCATCNNKRVGQPRRMMRHAKSKRHQKNLEERKRMMATQDLTQVQTQTQTNLIEVDTVAAAIEAASSRCMPVPTIAATSEVVMTARGAEKSQGKVMNEGAAINQRQEQQQVVVGNSSGAATGGVDIGVDELNNLMEL